MSKMSQADIEIKDQLVELGYQTIEEAETDGYHISYTDNRVKLCLDMSKGGECDKV